jgi:hypothetical protein
VHTCRHPATQSTKALVVKTVKAKTHHKAIKSRTRGRM